MTVIYDPIFSNELKAILQYIAQDKKFASIKFKNDLQKLINDLPNFPYKYRQSIYFDDKNVRDMVILPLLTPPKSRVRPFGPTFVPG